MSFEAAVSPSDEAGQMHGEAPSGGRGKSSTEYRPGIDGLRAVAVLSVVAFHADIKPCSGGYVGVDVFFVISGFLIGSLLLHEIGAGSFSASQFYKRRILRIAPALLVLLLVLTIIMPFVLFPSGLEGYVASMRSALLSISNFYFAARTNYFSDPYSKPLLHTWSLGVEEQFYFVLPLLLLLLRRVPKRVLPWLLSSICLLSLAASQTLIGRNASDAYYLPFSRLWELLLGTVLSYLIVFPLRAPRWAVECLMLFSIILVIAPVHLYSSSTPFPGLFAIPPCLGAALIIAFGTKNNSVVTKCLASRPLTAIGLISYSWYLWHWPVASLLRMGAVPYLPYRHRPQAALIVGLSAALAVLLWRYVERPFRSREMRTLEPRKVLATFGVLCVVLFGISFCVKMIPSPFSPESLAMAKYSDQEDTEGYRKGLCYIGDPYSFSDYSKPACLAIDPLRPNILIVGDSHAAAAYPGLREAFPQVNFLQATAQGCKPLRSSGSSANCSRLMKTIFYDFLPQHHVDTVLLIGRWLDASDASDLDDTISYLSGIGQESTVVGPSPEFRISLPRLMAYAMSRHDPSLPERYQIDDLFDLDTLLREHAEKQRASYISPMMLLCPNRRCVQVVQGPEPIPLLFDSNHFTTQGSLLFAERLEENGSLHLSEKTQ